MNSALIDGIPERTLEEFEAEQRERVEAVAAMMLHAGWASRPRAKRIESPRDWRKRKPRRVRKIRKGGRPPSPVRSDAGELFPSFADAAFAKGVTPKAISIAVNEGHKCCGNYWYRSTQGRSAMELPNNLDNWRNREIAAKSISTEGDTLNLLGVSIPGAAGQSKEVRDAITELLDKVRSEKR